MANLVPPALLPAAECVVEPGERIQAILWGRVVPRAWGVDPPGSGTVVVVVTERNLYVALTSATSRRAWIPGRLRFREVLGKFPLGSIDAARTRPYAPRITTRSAIGLEGRRQSHQVNGGSPLESSRVKAIVDLVNARVGPPTAE
jgi:hypothetical protein